MKSRPGQILFAFVCGLVLGVRELPWTWQQWVTAGAFIVWLAITITKEESSNAK